MTIQTTQKIIKVGSSLAVTIPAKQVKAMRIGPGSMVKITVEAVETDLNAQEAYKLFKKQYGETLKNLSQR